MSNVLFSFNKDKVFSPKTTLPDKQQLFQKIKERDLQPMVSLNGESAFSAAEVETHELVNERETRYLGTRALNEVGLIVNRLDRSFRYNESVSAKTGEILPALPEAWIDAQPVVNENAMRSLAFRKERMYKEVLEPLDLGIPTQIIQTAVDAAIFAHEHPAEAYIIKPNAGGTGGKGVMTVAATELVSVAKSVAKGTEVIVQPKYDFSGAMHPAIRAYDTLSDEAFTSWSKSDTVKEIRMYALLSPLQIALFPVGRAINDGTDHWFFIDPESVPDKLYDDTRSVVTLAAQQTGSRAVSAALDFGYGSLKGEHPDHHIIEYNGRMPYMIGYDKHPGVADTLREHFADMIHDTIKR